MRSRRGCTAALLRRPTTSGAAWRAAPARAAALALALAVALPAALGAQLVPDARWRTLRTEHLRVHFPAELEALGRRTAAVAESAWVRLAVELPEPRGPVDLVLADNVDFSNGSATPFPTNRVLVYARPPVDVPALRRYDDWLTLVVTHELAHVFHLDQAGGVWRLAQRVLGRHPAAMPNLYLPSWVKEGVAVYWESRLTGSGRLAYSQNPLLARAAALEGRLPAPGDLSLASPTFLGGEMAYAYGALAIDQLARVGGTDGVPRFMAATARQLVPLRLERATRRAFGVSLAEAWDAWRDSVRRATVAPGVPLPGWTELTRDGWFVVSPRWLDDGRLTYAASPARRVTGAYVVDTAGRARRIGRRNSLGPNVPLANGGFLYAQADFVDPFTIRSDLWVQRGDEERRLTRGARLLRPDARADGAIVAVQGLAGSSRLVRLAPDGTGLAALTRADADTQWTEPRWSPEGARVAAIRWTRGGRTAVVVLDTLGRLLHELDGGDAVRSSPSWAPDGRSVWYTSDAGGSPQLWRAELPAAPGVAAAPDGPAPDDDAPTGAATGAAGAVRARRVSAAATGLFTPEPGPQGERVAAVHVRADGYHVGVAPAPPPAPDGAPAPLPVPAAAPLVRGDVARARAAGAGGVVAPAEGPLQPYSPWRLLVPRYWSPLVQQGPAGGVSVGAMTSAADAVGRHAWGAQAVVEPGSGLWEWGAGWRWAGLGQPFVDAGVSQQWSRARVRTAEGSVGLLDERVRQGSLGFTLVRPRVRTGARLSIGGDLALRRWVPRDAAVAEALGDLGRETRLTPGVRVAASWTNVQAPPLAISLEDGVTLSASLRQRWPEERGGAPTRSAVVVGEGYRGLALGGFAHHVLAARVAAGWQDARATDPFEVGGVSGGGLELLPGLPFGGVARAFGVRGWAPAALEGTRALAGSLEWRAPLALVGRSVGHLPAFVQKASATAFVDAGAAWCGAAERAGIVCRQAPAAPDWLAGAGAELGVDLAPLYDVPVRLRVGGAVPFGGAAVAARAAGLYATLGASF